MEKNDLELIMKHRESNYELDRLYTEHLKLDEEVARLEQIKIQTPDDQKQLGGLKRTKLEGRDEMEKILQTLR